MTRILADITSGKSITYICNSGTEKKEGEIEERSDEIPRSGMGRFFYGPLPIDRDKLCPFFLGFGPGFMKI